MKTTQPNQTAAEKVRVEQNPNGHNEVASLWALRTLVDLNALKNHYGYPGNITSDGQLLQTIHLGELEDKEIKLPDFKSILKQKLGDFQNANPVIPEQLQRNLKNLADLVGLSKVDCQILAFSIILHSNDGLDSITDDLGSLSHEGVKKALALILQLDINTVGAALAPTAVLNKTGLMTIDHSSSMQMKSKLEMPFGFLDSMLDSHNDGLSLLSQYFSKAPLSTLQGANFEYLGSNYTILQKLLKAARLQSLSGINILLYGEPGTGKTELARLLATEVGAEAFEISTLNNEPQILGNNDRFRSYQLSQYSLENQDKALIIFDEIEDVFSGQGTDIFGRPGSGRARKAWVNKLLETNKVPAIWITNKVDQLDPAYLRRFSFCLEMEIPPRDIREKILKQYLQRPGIRTEWIKALASDNRVSPAMAANASRVSAVMMGEGSGNNEQTITRILDNSLMSLGKPKLNIRLGSGVLKYRSDLLNADEDIPTLLDGLKNYPAARICLYGPPGTGKTAFGHYVAEVLDKPLLVKRASDLLDMYVGNSEKNIAKMFARASAENAVLLLDEADSFLRDRKRASQRWEVTQVNELLTQMENFEGLFICSTNLMDELDEASIRRFDFKIKLDYLLPDQVWTLFQQALERSGGKQVRGPNSWKIKLAALNNLTPGDFALILRKNRLAVDPLSPSGLFAALSKESEFKRGGRSSGIGFTAVV